MDEQTGLTITPVGQTYEVVYYPPEWTRTKRGYYRLCRFVPPCTHIGVARFTDEDEARAFMEFLQRVIPGGREV